MDVILTLLMSKSVLRHYLKTKELHWQHWEEHWNVWTTFTIPRNVPIFGPFRFAKFTFFFNFVFLHQSMIVKRVFDMYFLWQIAISQLTSVFFDVIDVLQVSLLLTLNRWFPLLLWYFHCWLWTSNYRVDRFIWFDVIRRV